MAVDILYDLIFLIPFTLTVISVSRRFINDDIRLFPMVVIAFFAVIVLVILKHVNEKAKAIGAGVILAGTISVIMLLPSGERTEIIREHAWVFWVLVLVIVCFAAGMIWERYGLIRILFLLAGIVYLIFSFVSGIYINKLCISMVIIFAVFVLIDEIQKHSYKEGDTDNKKHTVGVSPFVLTVFIIIGFISIPSKPYDWNFVKKISEFAKSQYIRISETFAGDNEWDTDSPVIGFSDRSEPGGDLSKSERTVMEITARSEKDRKLYLAGKTFDTFNGRNWDKRDKNTYDERVLDTIETVSAVLDNGGDYPLKDHIKKTTITLEHKDMHTVCLFTPLKLLSVDGNPDEKKTIKPYVVNYYRINRDSDAFIKILNTPHRVDENSFENAMKECGVLTKLSYDDYLKYHEDIYKTYLPKTGISDEVRAYTDKCLEGAGTDYEKLCALEEMFLTFKYTEKPGRLPLSVNSEKDFLDYFILEKKEGYCSYYASAFVLLARAYGIPARYVQGYRVPMGKSSVKKVSSNNAHAWAEAYIDGVGWITFEPTPGLRAEMRWELQSEKEAAALVERADDNEEDQNEPEEESEIELKEESFKLHWYHIFIPILAGLLFSLLVFALDKIIRAYRYSRMDELQKAEYDCKRKMDALRRKHLGKEKEETLSEYAKRIKEIAPDEDVSFIELYERILYGKR